MADKEVMEQCDLWGKDKLCGEETEKECLVCREDPYGDYELIKYEIEQDRKEEEEQRLIRIIFGRS